MGGDGRVTMLFTRYVNDSLPGIAGYVTACNFYTKGTFAASNADEVFYARVATPRIADRMAPRMRSTVIHETKHLAAFAIGFANGNAVRGIVAGGEPRPRRRRAVFAHVRERRRWKGNAGFQRRSAARSTSATIVR